MMRRVFKVERMERSWWRGERAGLLPRVREREGDWKISRALDRFPVPWWMTPSR